MIEKQIGGNETRVFLMLAGNGYEVIGGVWDVRLGVEDRQRQRVSAFCLFLHVMVAVLDR